MNALTTTWKRTYYGRKFGFVSGLLLVFVTIGNPSTWAGDCPAPYVDPYVSPSGYKKWC